VGNKLQNVPIDVQVNSCGYRREKGRFPVAGLLDADRDLGELLEVLDELLMEVSISLTSAPG
jgi:hypothetical protein